MPTSTPTSTSNRPGPRSLSVVIDAEKTPIHLTLPKLGAMLVAVIAITSWVMQQAAAFASTADLKTHSTASHVKTDKRLQAVETEVKKLEPLPRQVERTNAKLDLLILQQVDRPGDDREAMRRAARKVRRSAGARPGSSGDPLGGLEGL